jgi:hypothetical protein
MEKRLSSQIFVLLTVVLMLSLFVTPFFSTVSAAGGQYIRLLSARFQPGKGVVFFFEYKGSFDSFKASALVNGKNVALRCGTPVEKGSAKNDSVKGTVTCIADGLGVKSVGSEAKVGVNGFAESGKIKMGSNCDPVYDMQLTDTGWEQQGTYCQANPATWGQEIYYYNTTWEYSYYYYFYNNGSEARCTQPPNLGPGFYWDDPVCAN